MINATKQTKNLYSESCVHSDFLHILGESKQFQLGFLVVFPHPSGGFIVEPALIHVYMFRETI